MQDAGGHGIGIRIEALHPASSPPFAMSRRAVYTGSFDPITLGHLNVIERSSRLVDELIVGIGTNIEKQPSLQRMNASNRWSGSRSCSATCRSANSPGWPSNSCAMPKRVIIRGVRSLSDMDTEFTMTLANRKLDPGIETVFLMADEEFSHVSSTLIKQITPLASDEELARFVPRGIIGDLRTKLAITRGSSHEQS